MKRIGFLRFTCLVILCALTVLTLVSCLSADKKVGNHTELSNEFITNVINDDYDDAYAMVEATVIDAEFREYWNQMQYVVDGAENYEIEQIGWNVNTTNGVTTSTTAHQVYFDNGKTILFRVTTQEGIEGIAGIYFSDATEFLNDTETFVPTTRIVLIVYSVLAIAFCIWMLVDCIRRKIKRKPLWIILILVGISFTVTVGETSAFKFMIGLMLQGSSVVADPSILSVVIKLVVPVGAIVYLCLRKKLTAVPESVDSPDGTSEAIDYSESVETSEAPESIENKETSDSNE